MAYKIKFKCGVDDAAMKVVSFSYILGIILPPSTQRQFEALASRLTSNNTPSPA